MTMRPTPAPGGKTPEAGQTELAGDAGHDAVAICNCTIARQTLSSLKDRIVDVLSDLLSLDPALAATWSYVVTALWPDWGKV
jgi:hypothetical protein